jgi:hypothetical protein
MHSRVWIVTALLLLVLALVPRPTAAASQAQVRREKTLSAFAALWEAVREVLSPQVIFGRLGPGMDPGGTPAPSANGAMGTGARPSRPPHPESDLGPGMDPLG